MELVLLLNRYQNFDLWEDKYTRIYFGNEFCPRLLPDLKEFDNIIKNVKKKNIKFTLLTPPCGYQDLKIIKMIINHLDKKNCLEEVVVNDYGVLHYVKRKFPSCEPILGRMLSYFSHADSGGYLNKIGIKRFEFDNIENIRSRVYGQLSFYYPYSFFFSTRYCPFAGIFNNKLINQGIINCTKECMDIGELEVDNNCLKKLAVLKGNTEFFVNKNNINFESLNIDRLVFQPDIPL